MSVCKRKECDQQALSDLSGSHYKCPELTGPADGKWCTCVCVQESHHIRNRKFFQQLLDNEYDIIVEDLHNFTSPMIACDMQFALYVFGH